MSDVKLPPLPYPQIPGNDYTAADMRAYAEQAVRDALASAPAAGEATDRIEQMAATRYRVVPDGMFRYKVVAGDGKRALYTDSKDFCLRVAAELTGAFLDGAFVASNAAPQASASQPVGRVRHFNYSGVARNGFSQEAVLNDDAPTLPDGTFLYAAPQASTPVAVEAVCKTCGGSRVDPGGLPICRDCGPVAGEAKCSERDMLEEARAEIEMIREALGVSYEPHQSLFDRMLEACDGIRQAAKARGVLEQAAAICDSVDNHANPMTARDCADAIRALIPENNHAEGADQ